MDGSDIVLTMTMFNNSDCCKNLIKSVILRIFERKVELIKITQNIEVLYLVKIYLELMKSFSQWL